MKKLKIKLLILCFLFGKTISAQFTPLFVTYGQTTSGIRGIGIGDFATFGATSTNARLHVNNFYCGLPLGTLNGLLFRTDGSNSINNTWDIWTGSTPLNTTQKFRITQLSGQVTENYTELGTVQNGKLEFLTFNTTRMTILGDALFGYNRSGFVGLNDNNPRFHLDINTKKPDVGFGSPVHGELMLRARIVDDPNAYLAFVNLSTTGTILNPALLGKQSETNLAALSTVGSITTAQDIGTNLIPVTRFLSGKAYDPAQGVLGLDRLNTINNRRIFGWFNGGDQLMSMEASGFLGVGITNPGNRVEINSDFYNALGYPGQGTAAEVFFNTPNTAGGTGFSGLRFSDLRSTSTPRPTNPGLGVLSVDENGDVIYVTNSSGSGGNSYALCSDPNPSAGQLVDNSKINLNDKNFYFTKNIASSELVNNQVAIGYTCGAALQARFNAVWDRTVSSKSIAGHFHNRDLIVSSSSSPIELFGIQAISNRAQTYSLSSNIGAYFYGGAANNTNIGVKSYARGGKLAIGGDYYGYSAINNIALSGRAIGTTSTTDYSLPSSGSFNIGGYFSAFSNANLNFGIYAIAPILSSTSTLSYAGYFKGNVHATGSITSVSDVKFKENINNERDALILISRLRPVTYNLKRNDYPTFGFDSDIQHGFIAQDVEQFLPELIGTATDLGEIDSLGNVIQDTITYKTLNYNGIISINTQAINELNQKVDSKTLSDASLKTDVQNLTNSLDKVKQMRGVSYHWNQNNTEMSLDSMEHVGFIAQEINQIDTRLTYVDYNNLMHVEYDKVVPIVVESIEELSLVIDAKDSIITSQQSQIDDLNARLTQLENCLSALLPTLCSMNQETIQRNNDEQQKQYEKTMNKTGNSQTENSELRSALEIRLSDKNAIILSQNVPNPFAEMTTIKYSIPTTVKEAQIHFYTNKGIIINSVDIVERGNGEIRVFAEDLSSGLYTYSLVADGKVVATKKMVKN